MKIDITKLKNYQVSKIHVDDKVDLSNYISNDFRIIDIKDVMIKGDVVITEDDNISLLAKLSGTLVLKDDITLEPVVYPFNTDIEEEILDNQFIIDITDMIFQNVLVEIPSKIRKTNEDIEISGDGWRCISEDKFNEERNKQNNPFANLSELLKTKEEE